MHCKKQEKRMFVHNNSVYMCNGRIKQRKTYFEKYTLDAGCIHINCIEWTNLIKYIKNQYYHTYASGVHGIAERHVFFYQLYSNSTGHRFSDTACSIFLFFFSVLCMYVRTRETHYFDIKSLMFHKRKTFSFFIYLCIWCIMKVITWMWTWKYILLMLIECFSFWRGLHTFVKI